MNHLGKSILGLVMVIASRLTLVATFLRQVLIFQDIAGLLHHLARRGVAGRGVLIHFAVQ